MNRKLVALFANPMTYVVGFAVCGAASCVSGIAMLAGSGWALLATGAFLLAFSAYIITGLTPNG